VARETVLISVGGVGLPVSAGGGGVMGLTMAIAMLKRYTRTACLVNCQPAVREQHNQVAGDNRKVTDFITYLSVIVQVLLYFCLLHILYSIWMRAALPCSISQLFSL